MSSGEEEESKQHEPTQKKLDDARKKGEIPRSNDLNTAASYGGVLLVAMSLGAFLLSELGNVLENILGQADRIAGSFFRDSAQPITGGLMQKIGMSVVPWFLLPGLMVILSIVAQRSFTIAPEKLMPKLSRISVLSNAKNKFGRNGLFEFAKSSFKLMIYSGVLAFFLGNKLSAIIGTVYLSPAMATSVLLRMVVEFLSVVMLVALVIGGVDFLWQQAEHKRRNMMSRKEMTDEAKQNEGDPHMKQQRRQKGYAIAMNQMLAEVPQADVIIVNPLHYAVALKWDRNAGGAPVCIAKGVDEIAARIRETASEAGVPIHRDPPTARALFATVEIGQQIMPEHYQAVAAAIRFAEKIRQKKTIFRGP
ncbi:MAG TPA: flagellar biosynthesis protein FlhB [Rhodobacteraceae bacterium]|nr:flagellar biosynthesis protein FlhB [Paracoccaceae bacterium]